MNTTHCYRLLGLNSNAGMEEVKASYRRLARQYHPDFNQDNKQAQNHFIRLTEAYQCLKSIFPPEEISKNKNPQKKVSKTKNSSINSSSKNIKTPPRNSHINSSQKFSRINVNKNPENDQRLKWQCYEKLREVMKEKRFARAIALVEGLSYRLPLDPEVRQWEAIVYQHKGRELLQQNQLEKARTYFNKALRTDPHNHILNSEIQKDLAKTITMK